MAGRDKRSFCLGIALRLMQNRLPLAPSQKEPTVEELQSKYDFTYYSTMNAAVNDVNAGTIGANADIAEADKADAVAGIYIDENGGKNVVLLKDHTQSVRIALSKSMTINLGGKKLIIENDYYGIVCASGHSDKIVIDGRLAGSAFVLNGADGGGIAISVNTNTVIVNGGAYELNETVTNPTYYAVAVQTSAGGSVIASDCKISVNAPSISIALYNFGSATASNCKVTAFSKEKKAYGLYNYDANAVFTSCTVKAYSNYTYDDGEAYYGAASQGVYNKGTLTLNDCYAMGTHSGVENHGTLTVNGGTYEGYGHGGIYFSGDGTTSYVRDAVLRDCDAPDGYICTAGRNGAGFYLGDDTNVKVYMDNCDIYGVSASQIAVIKTNGNTLYISNSTINNSRGGDANIRIDAGNKLYIGRGNNFTAENTSLPEAVVVTDEVYVQGVA